MTAPVRLRMSRKKGFALQALSLAVNGLPAVVVTRASKWGNPFSIHPNHTPGRKWGWGGGETYSVPTVEDAGECFRLMMASEGEGAQQRRDALHELRGKNLACVFGLSAPCHADVLLELANAP